MWNTFYEHLLSGAEPCVWWNGKISAFSVTSTPWDFMFISLETRSLPLLIPLYPPLNNRMSFYVVLNSQAWDQAIFCFFFFFFKLLQCVGIVLGSGGPSVRWNNSFMNKRVALSSERQGEINSSGRGIWFMKSGGESWGFFGQRFLYLPSLIPPPLHPLPSVN